MYSIAAGHSVPLLNLIPLNPQPQGDPVTPVVRTYGASGVVHERGQFCELHWNVLDSPADVQSLLQQLGLEAAFTASVTMTLRDHAFTFRRYNCTAVRPEPGRDLRWNQYFPRDFTLLLKDLEQL